MRWNTKKSAGERARIQVMGAVFYCFVLIILLRAFTYQVLNRERHKTMGSDRYRHPVQLMAQRGMIYDREKHVLAMDVPSISLALDVTLVKDKEEAALILSRILGGESVGYHDELEKNSKKGFIWIDRDITEDQKEQLIESKIRGLIFVDGRKRIYPYTDLGKQVFGIVNAEHRGAAGAEQAFEESLRGVDGWAIYQKDALNRNFVTIDYPVEQPIDGNDIVLTINQLYQAIVEDELRKGVDRHNAKSGSAVLMDPFTGEILSMATILGRTDGDKESDFNELMQNKAVQAAFEPGSTFKIVTAAAALEEGVFQSNSLIHCENGTYRLANHSIRDHNKAYSWLTLKQVMEVSSNIGMAKIGRKLGKETLYKYTQNFGFGNKTGINLPGEATGILRPVYRWTDFSTAVVSFGQEISVSTLQMVLMISVIANGGELLRPRIIKVVLDEDDREMKTFPRQVIRKVISENTAYHLTSILEGVILRGNGNEASVEGVRVAGKTGTAQKSIPGYRGYYPGAYVSSFVGFWPVEAPMFALVIVLDEAKEMYWGATSAAPIFSRIVSRMVGLPAIPSMPRIKEKKNRVKKTFVASSLNENKDDTSNKESIYNSVSQSPYHIPKLLGLSTREALLRLGSMGIEVRVEGSGIVVAQDPEPNRKIEDGMVCLLTCREPKEGVAAF